MQSMLLQEVKLVGSERESATAYLMDANYRGLGESKEKRR
jgi:hypothetical protein